MIFKPAPPHNPLKAPGVCLCVECCRWVLARRCQARDEKGRQCGRWKHRDREHTLFVETTFQIAEERVACADSRGCRWPHTCAERSECIAARPQPGSLSEIP